MKSIFPNIDQCIKEVRKYAKNKIYIIGYYNPLPFLYNLGSEKIDALFHSVDQAYQKIADKYDCVYISNYELFKEHPEYLPNPMDIHPNLKGYEAMADVLYEEYQRQKAKKY